MRILQRKDTVSMILALSLLLSQLMISPVCLAKVTPQREIGMREIAVKNLQLASAVAFDQSGNMYAGTRMNKIYKIRPDGSREEFADVPGSELLCITTDGAGNLYTSARDVVAKIDPKGKVTVLAIDFACADDLRVDNAGNLFVVDAHENRVYKLTPAGEKICVVENDLPIPLKPTWNMTGLTFSPDYTFLYVAQLNSGRVVRYRLHADGSVGERTILAANLPTPDHLTVDEAGNLYITCYSAGSLLKITPTGEKTTIVQGKLPSPTSIAFGTAPFDEECVYIACSTGGIMKVYVAEKAPDQI